MERFILKKLLDWKNSPYRKPLILKGVRQVGKTWILKEFGRRCYENTAYFNFDENEEYKQFFETTKDVDRILQNLMLASGQKILPEKTLIIFDEVQDCPKVINSMKYFCENAPQYHIACAGSLLGIALAKLAEEDPTFTVRTDEQSGQTVISGMGELHLDIIIDRLKREFKVECNQGRPQVNYKEAITKTVELREVYKKQSGGRGKFADIIVAVGPVDEDWKQGGLQFIDEVKGGNVPKEFIPSVQKGFQTAMKNGILAGFPLDSLKVVLKDGSFHPVDSDQLSFEICAIQAYKNACAKAGPVLMEPIMKLEVVTPEENMGDVIGDLNKRRGQVEGMESSRSGARIVKAMVPLAEMFGYVTALRTITSGRATSSMTYDHHAQVSASIAKSVLEEVKGRVDLI
mgnify:CR=1 FL=1